ncbi:MAG: DNA polymerase III subunit gamma/tau [Actinomycetota bacterium]
MATQSLYRRYRPRRFSELRGQEHVVRALRNAVINNREGQGYLFSGPRGTGKTSSARILAKVLNCTNAIDGEPCCECDSCIAVEAGNSYDVHELDAASNNGVDAMRDLIEKASLSSPGRHKVYILDEVHMLSKGAEAALLKTLEEPPPHVVFVLATTDPQKVSATIRSRVQHLEFHLLPMDELEQHVRWVAADAGLTVSEEALQAVLTQGGGSARDTLSALELVSASGGDMPDTLAYDEFIEAFIAHDPGQALAALAFAVQQGRDPRTLAQDIVRYLRDCFLSLMAPELVQLPDQRAAQVADQAMRMGAAAIVRSMEKMGEILVEMRHAPDPRLLLDVALVQLTHEAAGNDMSALLSRLERLEAAVAKGGMVDPSMPTKRPAPTDPTTGRAVLGGRARRDDTAPVPVPAGARPAAAAPAAAAAPEPVAAQAPAPAPAAAAAPAPAAAPSGSIDAAMVSAAWQQSILSTLKPMARALFSAGHIVGDSNGTLLVGLPNETHRSRCEGHRGDVEAAITKHFGVGIKLTLVVDTSSPSEGGQGNSSTSRNNSNNTDPTDTGSPRPAEPRALPKDEDVDVNDLIDAPPESVISPIDQLSQAFPGSKLIDEPR